MDGLAITTSKTGADWSGHVAGTDWFNCDWSWGYGFGADDGSALEAVLAGCEPVPMIRAAIEVEAVRWQE